MISPTPSAVHGPGRGPADRPARRTRRLLSLLLTLLLVAAACGSDGPAVAVDDPNTAGDESSVGAGDAVDDAGDAEPTDAEPADTASADGTASTEAESNGSTGDGSTGTTESNGSTGDGSTGTGDAASGDAATDVSGSTDEGDGTVDLVANTTTMVRALFNVEPSPEAVDCIIAESETRPLLAQAIAENNPVFSQYGDEMLSDVNRGINGCVDPLGLGAWAMEAVGPTGPVRETAPACFADAFSHPDDGDDLFHTFIALSFQYRYDPALVPGIVGMLADCTPVSSLTDFFATQHEQTNGFAVEVDRDCLAEVLEPRETSESFWTAFIDGAVAPASVVEPYLSECEVVPFEGLETTVPADFVAWSGTGALADVAPPARQALYDAPPPMSIDPAADYTAVFTTGGGEIRIRLFADTAPVTVNNFVSLARDGFYDGTVFHRVLDEFMAQGGDPTGTGTGGPGYAFEDEVDGGPALDRPGLLAMANSGPNTNGSQFFITFVATEWLTGNHTVFGEVIEGIEIVNAIERRDPAAPGGRGQILESVTIIEG